MEKINRVIVYILKSTLVANVLFLTNLHNYAILKMHVFIERMSQILFRKGMVHYCNGT